MKKMSSIGTKNFTCSICNKSYSGASGLWYHNKVNHNEVNLDKETKKYKSRNGNSPEKTKIVPIKTKLKINNKPKTELTRNNSPDNILALSDFIDRNLHQDNFNSNFIDMDIYNFAIEGIDDEIKFNSENSRNISSLCCEALESNYEWRNVSPVSDCGIKERTKSFDEKESFTPLKLYTNDMGRIEIVEDKEVPKKLSKRKRKRNNEEEKPIFDEKTRKNAVDRYNKKRRSRKNISKKETIYKARQDFAKLRPRKGGRFVKLN